MKSSDLVAELKAIVGPEAVITDRDALRTYDADASMIVSHAPQVVVLPVNSSQVAAIVRCAVAHGLPVVARGAGTGIAGGAIPLQGGVLISTARMDRIEMIEPRNRRAIVQSGVINSELNGRLAPLGYQFAPDPSSQRASTIGGNLGTNAGGPHCLKYGVTTNHIRAVEIALHDGSLLWSSDGLAEEAGYDLTGLIVGSEGTFGVVTRAMVRLTRLPEANRVVLALFPAMVNAGAAVSQIIAAGHLPTSLELMDHNAIRAVNSANSLGLPEREGTTLLIIEVDGVADGLDQSLAEILDICEEHQAFDLRPARSAEEQARVWVARKSVAGAVGRLAPAYYLVDTVVPRTRLPLMMEHVERLRHEHQLEVCNVAHAGDGNLHPLVLYDPRDQDQVRRAHAIAEGVLRLSIEQGGVISGEHGIGVEKRDFLPLLLSPADLQLHATVYDIFNPADSFNPAKIFPVGTSPCELAAARRARLDEARDRQPGASLHSLLASAIGADRLRQEHAALVVTPGSLEELCTAMLCCHRSGTPVVLGLDQVALNGATPVVVFLLSALKRVLTYEPDDQTIGVEAGMSLAELQTVLEAHGQFLPLEVADSATLSIGEALANALDDPRRLGYGALRDLVLGLTVVEPDGTLVKIGAQVVKNVTGYDLVKLYLGSRGTLGVIAGVSLRILPRPPRSVTLLLTWPNRTVAMSFLDDLAESRLLPIAVEYLSPAGVWAGVGRAGAGMVQLAVRSEGSEPAVTRHVRELGELGARHGAVAVDLLEGEAEARLWAAVATHTALRQDAAEEALFRLSVPPAELGAALVSFEILATETGLQCEAVSARALNGLIYARARGPAERVQALQQKLIARWRHSQVLASDPALRQAHTIWGARPVAFGLMQALKEAIDPYNLMNPGGYIV